MSNQVRQADTYVVDHSRIRAAPQTFREKLKFLGPGFILSASIVGSGELIATTVLGARAGFITLWVIIASCLIKVAIQLEFGRHAIISGYTPMMSFDKLPGLRIRKSNWAVWTVFLLTVLKVVQVGGILGGIALILNRLFPSVPVAGWAIATGLAVALLVYRNYYALVEKASLVMVLAFTVLTLVSLGAIFFTPFGFTLSDIASGLGFNLPPEMILVAIGAFGLTGVASDEIIAYNYWCIEKGYAAYAGPADGTPAWKERATGWIRVMYLDAFVAMLIYTTVTTAFYLLGAAILHNRGEVPQENDVIDILAGIYTQTLGEGIKTAYLVGAFFVLFSTIFATLAYWSRLFSDVFGRLGWINFTDANSRKRTIAILSWTLPALWITAYLFIELPVIMILFGGLVGSVLLILTAYAAVCFRYHKRFATLDAGPAYTALFWLSVLSIFLIAVYGILKLVV